MRWRKQLQQSVVDLNGLGMNNRLEAQRETGVEDDGIDATFHQNA
jgi:hypothetical protein